LFEAKEILHTIDCEGNCVEAKKISYCTLREDKIILIKGTGTGALAGVTPGTHKVTNVFHQNFSIAASFLREKGRRFEAIIWSNNTSEKVHYPKTISFVV
jgi:hypothetical protein